MFVFKQKKYSKSYKGVLDKAKEHNSKIENKRLKENTLYCPYCGKPLVSTGKYEHLQSLDEHVISPNSLPTKKEVLVCPDKNCKGHTVGKWTGDGSFYVNDWENYRDEEHFKGVDTYEAINSIMFKIELATPNIDEYILFRWWEKMMKKLGFKHPFTPVIKPDYKYDGFGKRVGVDYHLEYHMCDETGGHYILTSVRSRLRYLYYTSKTHYKRYKSYKDKNKPEMTKKIVDHLYGHFWGSDIPNGCLNKFWYKGVVPFVFGKLLGVKYTYNEEDGQKD